MNQGLKALVRAIPIPMAFHHGDEILRPLENCLTNELTVRIRINKRLDKSKKTNRRNRVNCYSKLFEIILNHSEPETCNTLGVEYLSRPLLYRTVCGNKKPSAGLKHTDDAAADACRRSPAPSFTLILSNRACSSVAACGGNH